MWIINPATEMEMPSGENGLENVIGNTIKRLKTLRPLAQY